MKFRAQEVAISSAGKPIQTGANVVSLADVRGNAMPVHFNRRELDQILRVYSFMVAGGEWRDYAIDHMAERAVFSIFRRASEMPIYRIEKNPKLAKRQGAWSVIAASGQILKRGHELETVLKVFDRQLKLVQSR